MFTIILSGPKSSATQARTALAAAGFDVHPSDDNHGLTDHPQGKKVRQAVAFIGVDHDDINAPPATVESLGWVLRAHHHTTPEPAAPTATPKRDELEQRLAALEAPR